MLNVLLLSIFIHVKLSQTLMYSTVLTHMYCTNIRPSNLIIEVGQEVHVKPSSGGQRNETQLSHTTLLLFLQLPCNNNTTSSRRKHHHHVDSFLSGASSPETYCV